MVINKYNYKIRITDKMHTKLYIQFHAICKNKIIQVLWVLGVGFLRVFWVVTRWLQVQGLDYNPNIL